MYNQIIGIDPGISGGIAIIDLRKLSLSVHKTPVIATKVNGKNRNETNIKALDNLLTKHTEGKHPIVFLEKVSMRPSDNEGKQFQIVKMLATYEAVKTVIKIFNFDMIEVMPRVWQDYLRLTKKGEEPQQRKNRFKRFAASISSIKTTLWNADAICIAEFGRRKVDQDLEWIREKLES